MTNIINIIVFSKIGFSESSTVVLFGLVLSDLGFLFLSCVSQTLDILDSAVGLRPLEPFKQFAYQVLWWYNMFYDVTILLTVFNAVQKCACVAIPLTFKSIFTTSRSIKVTVVIYSAAVIYYVPIFASPGTWTRFDYSRNWTRLYNYYYPQNKLAFTVVHIFSRIILPLVSQVIVIFCMIVLIYKLREAQRNRRSMGSGTELPANTYNRISQQSHKNTAREIRAIQTVTLVSAIFVVCNMPDILITFTNKFYPAFGDAMKYEGAFKMCSAIQDVFAVINSAVNIFVYLKYNSKYRRKFTEIRQKACRFPKRLST
ncbi:unnamed protein product [Candidula unifasciata]|uniref:G-protein coupled receptors family 1 profile domain-containing protein n=1 Tax=Candidula unifasciata TaxID=100452 RepID=A0A8S3Z2U4_9EUPU|nr:unnamed protein product [Candidula unifasciata]